MQKFSDAPLEVCEVCGGKLKRVFHPVGVVLKGSGFYSTDNRSRKALSPASKEGGSTETTPAEKPKKETSKKPAKKETGSAAS
jgi:predicted nucleic acid-binding Zn ribbon protein